MIELNVDFKTVDWDDFYTYYPKFSIALDGYVYGGPKFDIHGPYANFNHHEEVDRLATRSTCAQVLMAIRQGLFDRFKIGSEARANIYVNDCDEDVCTAWTLLKYHHLVEGPVNPLVNKLVAIEDALDCTAGSYPFSKWSPFLNDLAWIFQPYRQFRISGQLDNKNEDSYKNIICDVENRILRYLTGNGETAMLDLRYERIGGGDGWVMVKEIGAQARTGMFSDGIKAFVSVRERSNGNINYVIGKLSQYVPLDLERLLIDLNKLENNPSDLWGGGNTIIGSPRNNGSTIKPEDLTKLVDECIIRV